MTATAPRAPEELERALATCERALAEQRALGARAAEDFSKHHARALAEARERGRRRSLGMKIALAVTVVLTLISARRGRAVRTVTRARDEALRSLGTCRGDVEALRARGGKVSGTRDGSGRGTGDSTPRTLGQCVETLGEARRENERRASAVEACERRVRAHATGDASYFQDASEAREMLEAMKARMRDKDEALKLVQTRMRLMQYAATLVVMAFAAAAAHPTVRESFLDLVRSSDRRTIERVARDELAQARERSRSRSPARAAVEPTKTPPLSPTRFVRTATKTRIE
ncbi:unnamed product [Ostreococcus tauri]|uniref:Unnamed product n=1 Tax=Ostreococcus tauri TaxID=70448 RepID=Q017R7_OSTTA|nr:unnamed product [Ostreococcus tauri]CAL53344.1 unnamed product [Ostreococcus tauri]|eukprot:XP_003079699.1 unnamed product [Ostreococcus tauri]